MFSACRLYVGLADGVAEVTLVDAVELVGGRELHRFDDVVHGFTVLQPPLCFIQPCLFDCGVDRHAFDLREAKLRQPSRTAEVDCHIHRRNVAHSIFCDEVERDVDQTSGRYRKRCRVSGEHIFGWYENLMWPTFPFWVFEKEVELPHRHLPHHPGVYDDA